MHITQEDFLRRPLQGFSLKELERRLVSPIKTRDNKKVLRKLNHEMLGGLSM
jgi:hypothetical protein